MENKHFNTYDLDYANLYLERTIKRSYTIAKNLRISKEAKLLGSKETNGYFIFCDVGGNINGTVHGGLGDLIENNITGSLYYPVDLDIHYFQPAKLKANTTVNFRPSEMIHGIVGNGEDLPIKENSMNVVLISDVLEHIDKPLAALSEARRIIKTTGNLMVVSPALYKLDAMKPQNQSLQKIDKLIDMNGHINFFNRSNLESFLIKTGFNSITTKGIGFALSLPYLLWIDEKFIPKNYFNPKTRMEKVYRQISDIVNTLPPEVIADIDNQLNSNGNLKNFYEILIQNQDADILSGIYEILRYSSLFGQNSVVDESYSKLRILVESIKPNFPKSDIKDRFQQYVDSNGYEFLADSVLVIAK